MRIKEILNSHRRDFTALYVCEHCGHENKGYGYDDQNFHVNVIPNMRCSECKESSKGKPSSSATIPEGLVL